MDDRAFEEHCDWYEKHLRIVTKQGKLAPLVLNPIQRRLERWKAECFEKKIPALALILKARQEGVSTWAEATGFRDGRDFENRQAMVVAHKEDSTRKIFEMTKRFHRHFPTKIETEKSSARTLHFADTQSEFTVQTAGSEEDAGRGFTCQYLHVSELDYCPAPLKLLDAALQTIPDTYPAVIILETTAQGPGGAAEFLWNRAKEGKTAFEPFFFSWFEDPTYTLPVTLETVKKYAPEDWRRQNHPWITAVANKEKRNALGRRGSADPGSGEGGSEEDLRGLRAGERGAGAEPAGGEPDPEAADREEGTGRRGRVHGSPEDRREGPGGDGEVPGEPHEERRGVFREDGPGGSRKAAPDDGRDGGSYGVAGRTFGVLELFKDSLTPYEMGLIDEFGLSYDQINWLRYCLETKCSGDESVRKREYPSRPEECFEAAQGSVLDMAVLARWMKEAESSVPSRGSMKMEIHPTRPPTVSFDEHDRYGKIEVYEPPRHGHRYVLGLDASNGISSEVNDWTVACVMDVDSGVQVAEYRAKIDPDLAVEQIEALGLWYEKAYCIIETNGGFGLPYLRHILDRRTLPVYERMAFDKITRELVKRPGFDTNMKTRPILVAAMREAVRKEEIRLRSKMSISECRTLHERRTADSVGSGKIEARPGCHDDGFFAAGLALMGRNSLLGTTRKKEEEERQKKPMKRRFDRIAAMKDRINAQNPFPVTHVKPGSTIPQDGTRSRL